VFRHPWATHVLDRQSEPDWPNQKWIAYFTYIWTAEGWLYVVAVIDLFFRRVVGRSMNANMMSQLVTDALIMAIWRRGRPDARLAKNFEKTIEGAQLHGSLWPAYSS